MRAPAQLFALGAIVGTLLVFPSPARAQLLITGNDEKIAFDETGKTVNRPPGNDTVSIIDIHDPSKPRIIANLPLNELDHRPPGELDDHARPAFGAGRELARLGQGRRWLEGCARQQDLRNRLNCVAADADRHG